MLYADEGCGRQIGSCIIAFGAVPNDLFMVERIVIEALEGAHGLEMTINAIADVKAVCSNNQWKIVVCPLLWVKVGELYCCVFV